MAARHRPNQSKLSSAALICACAIVLITQSAPTASASALIYSDAAPSATLSSLLSSLFSSSATTDTTHIDQAAMLDLEPGSQRPSPRRVLAASSRRKASSAPGEERILEGPGIVGRADLYEDDGMNVRASREIRAAPGGSAPWKAAAQWTKASQAPGTAATAAGSGAAAAAATAAAAQVKPNQPEAFNPPKFPSQPVAFFHADVPITLIPEPPRPTPLQQAAASGRLIGRDDSNAAMSCAAARGSWQVDPAWPLYKGGSCPFVYAHQNCAKNGRPDRLYERLRWVVPGCPLPAVNARSMCVLVADRNIAFVGDSLTRNMFESLACLMHGFHGMPDEVAEVGTKEDAGRRAEARFHWNTCNFTVSYYLSHFFVDVTMNDASDPKQGGVIDLTRLDPSWAAQIDVHDTFVINTGHWWSSRKITREGLGFKPPHDQLSLIQGFEVAWETAFRAFVGDQFAGKTVIATLNTPNHFQMDHPDSMCPRTEPYNETTLLPGLHQPMDKFNSLLRNALRHVRAQQIAAGVGGASVSVLDIATPSNVRGDGHPGKYAKLQGGTQDCGHYCNPGVPDSWNELLLQRLWLLGEAQREE